MQLADGTRSMKQLAADPNISLFDASMGTKLAMLATDCCMYGIRVGLASSSSYAHTCLKMLATFLLISQLMLTAFNIA